jgi:outer membrane protein insertion porin family
MAYNQGLVDQSIRALHNTGLFEFIEIKVDNLPDNNLRLNFIVQPKYQISEIEFIGNKKFKASKLLDQIESGEDETLDEYTLKKDSDTIKDYYLKKGYSNVDVGYEIEKSAEKGTAKVIFDIQEGIKIRIKDIEFTGDLSFKKRKLRRILETKEYGVFSWITGSGKFNEQVFREDLDKLRDYYKSQGYLDVNISETNIKYDYPTANRLNITVNIDEGQQYKVGEILITGNTLYKDEELMQVLKLKTGDVFSPQGIDTDRESLVDRYGSDGYLDTRVQPERKPNLSTRNIDMVYKIRESEKYYVESVNIQGNTKSKSVVLLRELALSPGDVFDLVRMKRSKARLENTRFFDEVNLSPEPTGIPNRKNLRIVVKEKRTGNLTFGGGFSSLEQIVVFAEVSQSNFDLFNYRSFFQGDGQKFRLRLQLGAKSSEAVLFFEEPWLFEKQLALGFELFRRETDFNSTQYDESRTGFDVYLRKRLFELVEGKINYNLENVDIFDVDPIASSAIRAEEGETLTSKIGLSLLRDTRDNLLFPTTGSRYEVINQFAGGPFGGDAEYWKLEARGSNFFTPFETFDHTISLVYRAGAINPYGDKDAPFFDRFFLGGPNTLRGFDHRKVGPLDENNEPIGGDSYTMISAEYAIKIIDPLRLALFYDGGYVNKKDYDFDPGNYNDNWGFGARVMVMGAPLRLDLGFPISTEANNDDGAQFYFSFGTRF